MFIAIDIELRVEYEGNVVHIKYTGVNGDQVHRTLTSGDTFIANIANVLVEANEAVTAVIDGAMALEGKSMGGLL